MGTIEYQLNGKRCIAYQSNVANKAALVTLAHALHDAGLTHSAIPKVSYTEIADVDIPANSPPGTADVGMFANCLLRRSSDGELFGLLIHAPVMSMFDHVPKQGYRVKNEVGANIAELYSAGAGEPFTFHEGWLQGSSLRGLSAP